MTELIEEEKEELVAQPPYPGWLDPLYLGCLPFDIYKHVLRQHLRIAAGLS